MSRWSVLVCDNGFARQVRSKPLATVDHPIGRLVYTKARPTIAYAKQGYGTQIHTATKLSLTLRAQFGCIIRSPASSTHRVSMILRLLIAQCAQKLRLYD